MRRLPSPPPPPKTLGNGRYELQELLGTGGMAAVFRATDHWFGVDRALKLLLPHNSRSDKTRTRFLHEARTMAQLDHRNIVRIHDIGEEDENYYFVMELAAEGSLASWMRRAGSRPLDAALGFTIQALMGLDHAHTAGVVHRDVKPHNMLLACEAPSPAGAPAAASGSRPRELLKLTDFGIARVLASSASARITGTGDTLGTLAYMAPEQRLDPRKAGPQADLYGVGATLYILVTGRRPFDLAMANLDPSVMERLPVPLRGVVRRATAHRPEDRYQTARRMAEAIAEAWTELDPDAPVGELALDAMDESDTIVQVQPPPK